MKSIYLKSLVLLGAFSVSLVGCKLETGGSNSGGIGGTASCTEKEMIYGAGSRIIGGAEVQSASEASLRSVLLVMNVDGDDVVEQICSGVLLDSKHVLTAAHCLDRVRTFSNPLSRLKVFQKAPLGCDSVDPLLNPQAIGVSRHEIHPAYLELPEQAQIPQKLFSMHYDLAILQLERPVSFNLDDLRFYAGDGSDISQWKGLGFGRQRPSLSTTDASKVVLREVDLTLLQSKKSEALGLPSTIRSEYYFFDQTQGKGVCKGDSGSGVFIEREGEIFLAGIASFVFDPKNPMSLESCQTYSAYTQLAPHLDWIRASLEELRHRE